MTVVEGLGNRGDVFSENFSADWVFVIVVVVRPLVTVVWYVFRQRDRVIWRATSEVFGSVLECKEKTLGSGKKIM